MILLRKMKNNELKFEEGKYKSVVTRKDKNKYLLEWFDSTDFEKIKNVTQVYGYIFDNHKKLLIVNPKSTWRLPGGSPEKEDKNFENTLVREADEEADVEIKNISPLGYIKVTPLSNKDKIHYLLRYVAEVSKLNNQTEDIAIGGTNERKFIDSKDFSDYCDWGETGLIILNK